MTDDATLGGYERVHARPPAFGAADGFAYTASVFVDDEPDAAGRFGAALVFLRWPPGGERPVGHVETDYLAWEPTADAARNAMLELTLHEVKARLDACLGT
jgi:hypothetical protein